jgi:hypothetical protein
LLSRRLGQTLDSIKGAHQVTQRREEAASKANFASIPSASMPYRAVDSPTTIHFDKMPKYA